MNKLETPNPPADVVLKWGALLACAALGAIALYSAGVGLIDPKMHRAGGFGLALLVEVYAARVKRRSGETSLEFTNLLHTIIDFAMVAAGL